MLRLMSKDDDPMGIVNESYVLDASETDFLRIDYSSLRSTGAGPHEFKASL
jgi:hypothetical protein